MAIYLSDLMTNGALVRQAQGPGEQSFTAAIFIPAGTVIADNSQLKIARLADNLNVTEILVRSPDLDAGTTLSCSIGYERPTVKPGNDYNASTNPYVTGAVSAASLAYYGATATAPYQAGGVLRLVLGQSGLDNEFANNPADGVDGITDLCLVATEPAQTATAADGTIYVEVFYTPKQPTPGTFSGTSAFKYKSAY
jgi:hypothetical protein